MTVLKVGSIVIQLSTSLKQKTLKRALHTEIHHLDKQFIANASATLSVMFALI
jgi:hypothetical protein